MAPVNIDGTDIVEATIDGTNVSQITVDGDTVFSNSSIGEILRYKFDDSSDTTTAIDSVGGANATINGGATYTTSSAVGSNALEFDGDDDFTQANSQQSYNISDGTASPFTISAFLNWDGDTSTIQGIFQSVNADRSDVSTGGPPYGLFLNPSGELTVTSRDPFNNLNRAKDPNRLPENTYTHVTGEYDGSTLEVYRDNSLVASNTTNHQITDQIEIPEVGDFKRQDERLFNGSIDDVYLFDRKITDSERTELFNRGP